MSFKEYSYGIIPLQMQGDDWKVLLIQHERAKYWGFPKGHAEQGESPKEAAVRELREETNLEIVHFFSEFPQEEHYQYTFRGQLVFKTVSLFTAEVKGDLQLQEEEVSGGVWCTFEQALSKLTYEIDRDALRNSWEGI